LIKKFKSNASRLLTPEKIERAVGQIMTLDKIEDVGDLVSVLAL
jgi:hypothetical protein